MQFSHRGRGNLRCAGRGREDESRGKESIDASLERSVGRGVDARADPAGLREFAKSSPGGWPGNTPRHLRLIKRRTDRCAAASPLLNVSHLSPSFSTTETRRGETTRDVEDASSSTEENTAAAILHPPPGKVVAAAGKFRESLHSSGLLREIARQFARFHRALACSSSDSVRTFRLELFDFA